MAYGESWSSSPIVGSLQGPGSSLVTGIVIVSLMILPTIAVMVQASLQQVPSTLLQSATALGCNRWSIIQRVILPSIKPAISTAIILATGRALGENDGRPYGLWEYCANSRQPI